MHKFPSPGSGSHRFNLSPEPHPDNGPRHGHRFLIGPVHIHPAYDTAEHAH